MKIKYLLLPCLTALLVAGMALAATAEPGTQNGPETDRELVEVDNDQTPTRPEPGIALSLAASPPPIDDALAGDPQRINATGQHGLPSLRLETLELPAQVHVASRR